LHDRDAPERFVALVPAAGSGSRLGHALPKQYLPCAGRPLIHHALRRLASHRDIATVYVALSPEDDRFDTYDWRDFGAHLAVLRCGGATRAETVRNGLRAIEGEVDPRAWVLVHDAARPCLTEALLERLIGTLRADAVGGIAALPVADTLKRADADRRIAATVPREGLWQAQTPQMFRYGLLRKALEQATPAVTDEASAVEALGLRPVLVEGEPENLKVTYARDLPLAEALLAGRGSASPHPPGST
jgi:2-C-methyl-D-erythritol 4-phosphate cytidylyltransferase